MKFGDHLWISLAEGQHMHKSGTKPFIHLMSMDDELAPALSEGFKSVVPQQGAQMHHVMYAA